MWGALAVMMVGLVGLGFNWRRLPGQPLWESTNSLNKGRILGTLVGVILAVVVFLVKVSAQCLFVIWKV